VFPQMACVFQVQKKQQGSTDNMQSQKALVLEEGRKKKEPTTN